jgi:hypothetical protein
MEVSGLEVMGTLNPRKDPPVLVGPQSQSVPSGEEQKLALVGNQTQVVQSIALS